VAGKSGQNWGGSAAGTNGSDFGTVAVGELDKDGAYPATTTDANVGPNNNYTIYRPQELAPIGAKNPVVVWISGGGSSHSQYTLLPHLATHGFVIIASNTVPGMGTQADLGAEPAVSILPGPIVPRTSSKPPRPSSIGFSTAAIT
jgi:hypothetical protein